MSELLIAFLISMCGSDAVKSGKLNIKKCKVQQSDCAVIKKQRESGTYVEMRCRKLVANKKK